MTTSIRNLLCWVLGLTISLSASAKDKKITHSFLATGAETRLISDDRQVTWRSPLPTRDGWVLKNDNVLLAVGQCKEFPNGGVIELTRREEVIFKWQGTQAEVNTVEALPDDRYLVSEAGPKPRLIEI